MMQRVQSHGGPVMNIEKVIGELTNEEKAQLCSGRDFWHTQDIPRLGIGKVMVCDGPNGLRKQIGEGDALGINESIETECYPTEAAVASSFDTDLIQRLGEHLGEESQAEDIGMLLGPGVNMKRSPLCGRNFEYLSEDPYLAGKMASAYIRGVQSRGVACCVKHFACNNQENGRLSGSSMVNERTLREIYLPAFEMAVKEGKVRSVMNAYNAVNGTFCAENGKLLTDILRKEWGFRGMVVTDWGAVKDRVKGLLAGVDLEMPGSTEGKTERILKALEDGTLPQEKLDEAVGNVLTFVDDACRLHRKDASFDRKEAAEFSLKCEEECAVLLKNEGALPIVPEREKGETAEHDVALIGPFVRNPRYQGAGSSHINVKHVVNALECASDLDYVYAEGCGAEAEKADPEMIREAVAAAESAETAVIFAGLPESSETEGVDRESMKIPEAQNELIRQVAAVQKNTVVVLHGGAPMELPWLDDVNAVLCMYLGGDQVGRAAMDLLTGRANPSGKLAESWPKRLEDNPSYLNFPDDGREVRYNEEIYIGYRYYDKKKIPVNFCFGHGLSYTEFEYSDFRCDHDALTDKDILKVSCRVKNVGARAGREAVQLYVGRPDSRVSRPVRELKGFQKILLLPGEEKEIVFELNPGDFAYYETKVSGWFVDSGRVVIEIGSSSRDIRLVKELPLDSSMKIPVTYSRNSTIGDLFSDPDAMSVIAPLIGQSKEADTAESTDKEENARVDNAMGAGSARMRQRMMMDMPLGSLVSYGRMSDDQLDALLCQLNAKK